MVAQINKMQVGALRYGQFCQGGCNAIHIVQMFID